MRRKTLTMWEDRVRKAPIDERMGIIHEFADSLDGNEGKIATSFLRMTTMARDIETKSIERKATSDRLMFFLSISWQLLLLVCLLGGIAMIFHDKIAATELVVGGSHIKTSSIGVVLIFIAIVLGGKVVIRAIENLRQE